MSFSNNIVWYVTILGASLAIAHYSFVSYVAKKESEKTKEEKSREEKEELVFSPECQGRAVLRLRDALPAFAIRAIVRAAAERGLAVDYVSETHIAMNGTFGELCEFRALQNVAEFHFEPSKSIGIATLAE